MAYHQNNCKARFNNRIFLLNQYRIAKNFVENTKRAWKFSSPVLLEKLVRRTYLTKYMFRNCVFFCAVRPNFFK